jgi:hypothetical protein
MVCEPPAITFIPCEAHFRPVLPTIEGNVDYLALRGQLITLDELLRTSGVETEFVGRSDLAPKTRTGSAQFWLLFR